MLRQSGSFSEEISLNNEELDQLDSIYSGQSDSEEFTPTRTVDRYGESYEVAYSYDSDLDSTMDLRDDEHQLTSFMWNQLNGDATLRLKKNIPPYMLDLRWHQFAY